MKHLLLFVLFILPACNENPVFVDKSSGAIAYSKKITVAGSTELDLLWVIDNSGSMCEEQKILSSNFERFVDEISETNLDFQIGVTTTHLIPSEQRTAEPIALAGHLQSTPQPVSGSNDACRFTTNDAGEFVDWGPVRDALAAAVACMTTPDESYLAVTDEEIDCAFNEDPNKICAIANRCTEDCSEFDLFPDQSDYRVLSKVLHSETYRDGNGVLDVDAVKADFACMSLVGTRGDGVERGLGAVLAALDPELIGGSLEEPVDTTAPNHGLIRKDARFGVVFVTDENDCTHDGTLDFTTSCIDFVCDYANIEGEDSALVAVEDVKERMMENLLIAKNRNFGEGEVLVTSIHGAPQRYSGPVYSNEQCAMGQNGNEFTCATENGLAKSGDRYVRFLETFPPSQYYPKDDRGHICEDFAPALKAIGEFVSTIGSGCVTRDIFPCESDSDCPNFPISDAPGSCLPRPNSETFYCNSGIQVRAQINKGGETSRLTSGDYCVPDSFDLTEFPNGCVVSPTKYALVECPADLPGVKLSWIDETEAKTALVDTSLELRYQSEVSD